MTQYAKWYYDTRRVPFEGIYYARIQWQGYGGGPLWWTTHKFSRESLAFTTCLPRHIVRSEIYGPLHLPPEPGPEPTNRHEMLEGLPHV